MIRRLVSASPLPLAALLPLLALLLLLSACAPRLSPLAGVPVPVSRMPNATLLDGHHRIVFDWQLDDQEMSGKGEGVARIASPDSARLDFFLGGGFGGGGSALLIGDVVQVPGPSLVRKLVPPPALLWAALGRVALPNLADTVIRSDGSILRVDIGQPVAWRLTFHGDTLARAERVDGGRVREWVERSDATHVQYRDVGARRSLRLTITRMDEVPEFDASTWHLDR
jgi:hypothetical protein